MIPYIFDIKRSSTVDGPGLRTAVFFKGCNLDCKWCHNPESKSAVPQLAIFSEKCIGCGACTEACEHPDNCSLCGECVDSCPADARRIYGSRYTVDELYEIICADTDFYRVTGGGVTFSGGECMLYPDFLAELAEKCVAGGIDVAIDTAGNLPPSNFEKVLPYTSCFLYDIKALDPELHRAGTGADNQLILENLEMLIESGKRIIIRTPVIPGYNDGGKLQRIKQYCTARGLEHETLPYHSIGESKRKAIKE